MAAIAVATLSVLLIWDSVRNAERAVIADMSNQLTAAVSELAQQYAEGKRLDSLRSSLPPSARDIALRGISQSVLGSYRGAEGGYFADSQFLGYSFPTHDNPAAKTDVPPAERSAIQAVVEKAVVDNSAEQLLRGGHDLVLIEAKAVPQHQAVAWAMKRRTRDEPAGSHRLLLVALGMAALLSVIGTLQMGVSLRRGVAQIQGGLTTLEKDFSHTLPEGSDELGEIRRSINRMAAVRRRLEEELRREDRLRAVGRTVAGIAHELRNPLNGIRLSIQLLDRRLKRGTVQDEDLQLVISEVDRMEALLGDLLSFREKKRTEHEEQDLLPLIQRCVHLAQPLDSSSQVRIGIHTDGRDLKARFDSRRLMQVVMNLLLNAIEAVHGAGRIDIHLARNGENVRIEVADSGPGLTADQKEHLFEAFYTTKPEGTGLGLAVSRELVAEMGGSLTYLEGGGGATFAIELPAVRDA